jgi:hypothetical protein
MYLKKLQKNTKGDLYTTRGTSKKVAKNSTLRQKTRK